MENRGYGDRGRDGEGNRIGSITGGSRSGGKGPKETRLDLDGMDRARMGLEEWGRGGGTLRTIRVLV